VNPCPGSPAGATASVVPSPAALAVATPTTHNATMSTTRIHHRTMPIASITIGPRHRHDLGDLAGLARSIQERGWLQPIGVTPAGQLVVGLRRLEAAKLLGLERVPVHVVHGLDDALDLLLARTEADEHTKPLLPSEMALRGLELEQLIAADAERRHREGSRRGAQARNAGHRRDVDNVHTPERAAPTRDRVGQAVGTSGRRYERAKAVVLAAQQDPERYGDLVEEMDATGKVNRVHTILQQRQTQAEREAQGLTTSGQQSIITGDFRGVGEQVEDASVSLILTDGPYSADAVPLYGDLARLGARVLCPGGVLLAYSGQAHLPGVLATMSGHGLDWLWVLSVRHEGGGDGVAKGARMRNRWKPLLAFVRPPRRLWWTAFPDELLSGQREKSAHAWQQSEQEAAWLIERLTLPGDLVLDPMVGSGTTLAAAKRLGRRWLGIEIDARTAAQARGRLAEIEEGAP
jgi:ParB-like chromosome segregation protein Spo0J